MSNFPVLVRSVSPSGEASYALGDPLVDRYLEFVRGRCRANPLARLELPSARYVTIKTDMVVTIEGCEKLAKTEEGPSKMSKVLSAMAVSVDGYITGRDPGPGCGLGDGGTLFDWYGGGDETKGRIFDAITRRVGATFAGRNTYEDSDRFGNDEGPHPTAPLIVLSHHPAPQMAGRQTLVTTGIEDAVAVAREAAGDQDVALMGGGVVTEALKAGLVDELILHQVPVLLGAGRSFFQQLPGHIRLRLVDVVAAAGVTHLHYEVDR